MAGNCSRMPRTASCPVGQGADAGLRIGIGPRDLLGGRRCAGSVSRSRRHISLCWRLCMLPPAGALPLKHTGVFTLAYCAHALNQCEAWFW